MIRPRSLGSRVGGSRSHAPARWLPLAALVALFAGACSKEAPSDGDPDSPALAQGNAQASDAGVREGDPSATADAGSPLASAGVGPGLLVRRLGKVRYEYEPWTGEEQANRIFRTLRREGGGHVHFMPGTYVIEQGFHLSQTPNLRISGSPEVRLEFAPEPERIPLTTAPAHEGDTSLVVDDATGLRVGWDYQLYSPTNDSTRVLEFTIAAIEDDRVHLKDPVGYMPNIKEIPPGSRVFEEINFFEVFGCPGLVLEGLVMDGMDRGTVRGHTLYGGVYATGLNPRQQRPEVWGLTIRNCSFRGLKGRGVAAYGIGGVHITDSSFRNIYAQAIEIDHFSSGLITNNLVDGAEAGVMLNDAFESIVEGNQLLRCRMGVRILRIFPQDWVNLGNIVRDNRLGWCEEGIVFQDRIHDGLTGNSVLDNHFIGIPPLNRVVGWRGNTVSGNTHE